MSTQALDIDSASSPVAAAPMALENPFDVTTARGHTLTLKKPNILAPYHLVEALGELSRNQVYMSMVTPLLLIYKIDGELVQELRSKADVEHLIERLGEDGMAALVQVMMQMASSMGQVIQ